MLAAMDRFFIEAPGGQFISAQHIVSLGLQQTGREDQLRHEAQATLVTGDKQLLKGFQGSHSRQTAEQYLSQLMDQLGVRRFQAAVQERP
jgi:hypothetical protein